MSTSFLRLFTIPFKIPIRKNITCSLDAKHINRKRMKKKKKKKGENRDCVECKELENIIFRKIYTRKQL